MGNVCFDSCFPNGGIGTFTLPFAGNVLSQYGIATTICPWGVFNKSKSGDVYACCKPGDEALCDAVRRDN